MSITIDDLKIEAVFIGEDILLLVGDAIAAKFSIIGAQAAIAELTAAIDRHKEANLCP